MNVTHKTLGLGIAAVAVLMLGTAAIADKMDGMQMGDMGGPQMMGGPDLDLTAMDADKDGKISKDELTAFRTARVAEVDANADGKLSVDEIAAMHIKAMEAASLKMAERMVERLDSDGDKMLTAAEMLDRPMPTALFDRLDANEDGFVDQAELDAAKARMMERGGRMGGGRRGHHSMGEHGDGPKDSSGMGGN